MNNRAVGLGAIPVTGDARQLASGLAAGMTIGTQVPASEPAVIGAILIRTVMRLRIDSASASSGEGEERR